MSDLSTITGTIDFVTDAHWRQKDKQGQPYVLHVLRVGASLWRFPDDYIIAGMLHDIVEDTVYTLDDLSELGASDAVVRAVEAVTKTESERTVEAYQKSVKKAVEDPIGLWVKAADMADNYKRLPGIQDEELRQRLLLKYLTVKPIINSKIPRFDFGEIIPLDWPQL